MRTLFETYYIFIFISIFKEETWKTISKRLIYSLLKKDPQEVVLYSILYNIFVGNMLILFVINCNLSLMVMVHQQEDKKITQ